MCSLIYPVMFRLQHHHVEIYLRRLHMMTSSNGNIFRVTGHLCGEFTGPRWIPTQRPVTRSFGVFFDLRLNIRLNKQWWGWWFETRSRPLWRHRNVISECIICECKWEWRVTYVHKPMGTWSGIPWVAPCNRIKCHVDTKYALAI